MFIHGVETILNTCTYLLMKYILHLSFVEQAQNKERDILELQETNVQLQAQLHHMSTNLVTSSHPSKTQSLSLFSEISQMSPDHISPLTSPESSKTVINPLTYEDILNE
jgi:hypothetical protein